MTATSQTVGDAANNIVSKERLLGKPSRWRRHGEPILGGSEKACDDGVFGPGSIAWDIILHPATMVFQSQAQFILQLTYKPVFAGVRDHDPISRKARLGTLNMFDVFDREQRNSGIHVPMWIGDSNTARRVADHLVRVHEKVAGPTIDIGNPELGGYAANSPRESMWATLTEMHSMLWVYESLAFRGLRPPRRLPEADRDRYIREVGNYIMLFPHEDARIPKSMSDLRALYQTDASLFGQTKTLPIIPETNQNLMEIWEDSIKRNLHPSQKKVKFQLFLQDKLFRSIALSAVSKKTRRNFGVSAEKEKRIILARFILLPLIWLLQQGPIERYFMRMMWGPDAVKLITSARVMHRDAKRRSKTHRETQAVF